MESWGSSGRLITSTVHILITSTVPDLEGVITYKYSSATHHYSETRLHFYTESMNIESMNIERLNILAGASRSSFIRRNFSESGGAC